MRRFLRRLECFFKSYNEAQGREFQILAARGPRRALSLIRRMRRG